MSRLSLCLTCAFCWLTVTYGCIDRSMLKPWWETEGVESEEDQAPAARRQATDDNEDEEERPAGQGNIAPRDVKTLVDARKAKAENPNLIEVENRINAIDPVSAAGSAYFSITTRAQLLNLKHAIDLYKAENDNKHPDFATFSRMLKENNVQLNGLYRWQVYGYDDQTGTLMVLEDPELKSQLRSE